MFRVRDLSRQPIVAAARQESGRQQLSPGSSELPACKHRFKNHPVLYAALLQYGPRLVTVQTPRPRYGRAAVATYLLGHVPETSLSCRARASARASMRSPRPRTSTSALRPHHPSRRRPGPPLRPPPPLLLPPMPPAPPRPLRPAPGAPLRPLQLLLPDTTVTQARGERAVHIYNTDVIYLLYLYVYLRPAPGSTQ